MLLVLISLHCFSLSLSLSLCFSIYLSLSRYHLRGVKHLVFYSLPTYSEFYPELVNMLEGVGQVGGATCTIVYSTYDALSLSRIVGTGRANRLLKSTEHIQTLISGTLSHFSIQLCMLDAKFTVYKIHCSIIKSTSRSTLQDTFTKN